MTNALVDTTAAISEKIVSIGEHLRLQAHLGSMEAADAWDTLSTNFRTALQRATAATERVGNFTEEGRYQAELALMQAKDSWQALKAQVEKTASEAGEASDHLIHESKEALIHESRALLERLEDGVKSLTEQIKH